MSQDVWDAFVEVGARLVSEAALQLSAEVSGEAVEAALDALTALELDARVVGIEEIAEVAGAARVRLAHAAVRAELGDDQQTLREALEALERAFTQLANPDASGARLEDDLLGRTRERLLTDLPPPPPPPALASTPPDADEDRWVPSVDEDMIDPFLDECQERLAGLGERLIELEREPDDELVKAIFRDLHTLKGSSAFVGLKKMTRVAHAAEDLMGLVRDGKREVDRPLIDALLSSMDALSAIVDCAAARAPIDVDVGAALASLRGLPAPPGRDAKVARRPSEPPGTRRADGGAARSSTLRIEFDKLDLLMNLVGELVLAKGRLHVGMEGLQSLGRELDNQRRHATVRRRRAARAALGDGPEGGGGLAVARAGGVRPEDLATELSRVQRAFEQVWQELDVSVQQLEFVSGELRDQVMKLRMVPIGRTWSKYHRTVREIAHRLGKQVRLTMSGGETELDKVLVEQLDDPFLHLVRNAIDHGVEPPDVRVAAGKAPEGQLTLAAFHRGNQIVIRIEDDGAGIDAERVRSKAIEKGLIDPSEGDALDDAQIHDLIFRAGFSTASAVSDLSGRGVGMDVVRETIARLKGTVTVESTAGRGSRFEVRLPLTLAIIQVLLVRCAGETFAVPIDLVRRTVSTSSDEIREVAGREVLHDNGLEVPLLRLQSVLGLPSFAGESPLEMPVVLVDVAGQPYGLMCDGFLGRQEIVIKSLGNLLERVPGAAGATLLGDRCVLILDVPAVTAMAAESVAPPPAIAPVPASAGRGRVLVAEDADVIRESIRRTLEAAGYEVAVARDGQEALDAARVGSFDLVSTDVVMPRVDGYELTRQLRQMPAYRDVPIVMVTSKAERIDRIRGFDAGVDAYLTKPTDAAELLRVISRYLSRGTAG